MEPTRPSNPLDSPSLLQKPKRRSLTNLRFFSSSSNRTVTLAPRFCTFTSWMTDLPVKVESDHLADEKNLILPLFLDRFLAEKKDLTSRYLILFIRGAEQYQNNPSTQLAEQLFNTYLQLPIKASPLQANKLVVTEADAELIETVRKGLPNKEAHLFNDCVQALLPRLNLADFQKSDPGKALQKMGELQETKEGKGKTDTPFSFSQVYGNVDTEALITSQAEQTFPNLQEITQAAERTQIDYITWKAERLVDELFLTHPLVIDTENRLYSALTTLTEKMVKEGRTKENMELWCALAAMLTPDSTLPNVERIIDDLPRFPIDTRKTLTEQILTKTLFEKLKQLKKDKAKLIELGKRELNCQLAIASLPNRMIEWRSPTGNSMFLGETPKPEEILPGVKLSSAEDLQSLLNDTLSTPFSTFTIRLKQGQKHTFDVAQLPEKESPHEQMKALFNGVFDLMIKAGLTEEADSSKVYDTIFLQEWKEALTTYPWLYYLFSFSPPFRGQWEKDIWGEKKGYGMLESKQAVGSPTLTIDISLQEITTRYTQTYEVPLDQDKGQVDLTISQEFSKKPFFRRGSARMGHLQIETLASNLKGREQLLKKLTKSPFFADQFFSASEQYSSHELRASYVRRGLEKEEN